MVQAPHLADMLELTWEHMEIDVSENGEDECIDAIREKMEQNVTFLSVDLLGECDLKFTADSIPRINESCEPMFKHFELNSGKTKMAIDVNLMMERYPLPPLLSEIQNEILSELKEKPNDLDLLAELIEFWRNLRDSGLIGDDE